VSELKYIHILILRAVSLVRVRFIVQSLQFITRASGLRAQIITQLNSQPCSNWRYSTQNQNIFPKCKCNGIMQNLITIPYLQYSKRGTFINPLTPVVSIIHARSNTATEHPLTLVVMNLAFRDDGIRGFAVVACEGSSRSTVFHRLYNVHVNCLK